jgi:hypothetical protein
MTTRSEDTLLPVSAIAAMLVAASLIVGLAYWVGDSIAPDFAALLPVATREADSAPPPAIPVRTRIPDDAAGR